MRSAFVPSVVALALTLALAALASALVASPAEAQDARRCRSQEPHGSCRRVAWCSARGEYVGCCRVDQRWRDGACACAPDATESRGRCCPAGQAWSQEVDPCGPGPRGACCPAGERFTSVNGQRGGCCPEGSWFVGTRCRPTGALAVGPCPDRPLSSLGTPVHTRPEAQVGVAVAPDQPPSGRAWLRIAWEPAAADAMPAREIVERLGATLPACVLSSAELDRGLHAELVVSLTSRADGSIESVTPVSIAGRAPDTLVGCVATRLRQWRLPAGTGTRGARIIVRVGAAGVAPRATIGGGVRRFGEAATATPAAPGPQPTSAIAPPS